MDDVIFLILRVGLGVTFIWMSVLIFKDPMRFGKLVKPWAARLVPTRMENAMYVTAVFDVVVGFWLLAGFMLWVPALLAALHMAQVLIVTGAGHGTFRDFGLMCMGIALYLHGVTHV